MTSKLFQPRCIGVCGKSYGLEPEAVSFCRALGRRLARDSLVTIVSGGAKHRSSAPANDFAADWWIVSTAQSAMRKEEVFERVITVVREEQSDDAGFRIGTEQRARGRTGEARRISFVRGVDALIAVGGGRGTSQELALAIEHDIPVLPVPMFGGAAQEYWDAYRSELLESLNIQEEVARRWESAPPASEDALQKLADEMVDALFDSLPRRCFVIMPFHGDFDGLYDFVIQPAIRAAGDEPIRLDRLANPGDIKKQIDDGLKHCEYAIAVLDQLRPNVLYELGIAHGRGKPTILMNRKGAISESDAVPFDLFTQHRLEYASLDAELPKRLTAVIDKVSVRRRR
jgi:predicted Rossmann-fold nucleotide-binding protein